MELINGQKITLGTCYYPEHWDKNLWREDLERMKECGIEVVRIAEFAWSKSNRVKVSSLMNFLMNFWTWHMR